MTPAGKREHRVAGEPVQVLTDLLAVLADRLVEQEDGSFAVQATFSAARDVPLRRALMRIEAELLLEDARWLQRASGPLRSHGERRGDALTLLSLRTGAALGEQVPASLLRRYLLGRHRAA